MLSSRHSIEDDDMDIPSEKSDIELAPTTAKASKDKSIPK
jgi:hypothetical protein